jgi:hypothetical protein
MNLSSGDGSGEARRSGGATRRRPSARAATAPGQDAAGSVADAGATAPKRRRSTRKGAATPDATPVIAAGPDSPEAEPAPPEAEPAPPEAEDDGRAGREPGELVIAMSPRQILGGFALAAGLLLLLRRRGRRRD